jgi:uncharacterized RDD family membrane protein YckC
MFSLFGSPETSERGRKVSDKTLADPDAQATSTKRESPNRALNLVLGWTLRIVGRSSTIIGAASFVILTFFVNVKDVLGSNDFGTDFSIGAIVKVICAVVCVGGLKVQLLGHRYLRRAGKTLKANGIQPERTVIYLRPFKADSQTTRFDDESTLWDEIAGAMVGRLRLVSFRIPLILIRLLFAAPRTEEEQLGYALKNFGTTIAVAQPGESLPPAGIPRIELNPGCWQDEISTLLREARLVVMRCGSAFESEDGYRYWRTRLEESVPGGLGWEIQAVVKEVPPEKLILLVPFNGIEYAEFRSKANRLFPKELPAWIDSNPRVGTIFAFISFDREWNASFVPITWIDTSWRLDSRYPLAQSLREKFESVFAKEDGARKFKPSVKRLFATAVDALLVIPVFLFMASLAFRHHFNTSVVNWLTAAIVLAVILTYGAILEASGQMSTFGKRLFGLVVSDPSSQPLVFARSLKRNIFKLLLFPITWVGLLRNPHIALHDRLSGAVVTNQFIRKREPGRLPFTVAGWTLAMPLLLILIVMSASMRNALQPPAIEFPQGQSSVNVPFSITRGSIPLFPVDVQGHSLFFVLSTVCGKANFDRATAQSLKLLNFLDSTAQVDLAIGPAKLVRQAFQIADLSELNKNSGDITSRDHIAGCIGYDLLKRAVVKLNYESNILTISDPSRFTYRGEGFAIPITISKGWPSASAKITVPGREPIVSDLWIDSTTPFAINHPSIRQSTGLLNKTSTLTGSTGSSVVVQGIIESVKIADLTTNGVPSTCCTGIERFDRQIGNGFLSRFIVTFDYPHQRMILENYPKTTK